MVSTELVKKVTELDHAMTMKKIEYNYIKNALKECKTDKTELYWSAYGCLSLVNGWGKEDVMRLFVKVQAELEQLQKELDQLMGNLY